MEDKPNPYEVHCQHCQTSFPVGTRQCVHCGGRIAAGGRSLIRLRPSPQGPVPSAPEMLGLPDGEPEPRDFLTAGSEAESEEEEARGPGGPLRISLWGISVGLALMGSMFRACQGG